MDYCNNCPVGLFNTKHRNLQGVGNPWSGKCIVVPNVDYDAYKVGSMDFSSQVSIIKEVLNVGAGVSIPSTGDEDLPFFIVPLIRCNESISCPLDNVSYNKCLQLLAEDVRKYNFKDIILLGDAARRFLAVEALQPYLDTIFVSKNKRRYAVNYSPSIKYTGEYHYEIFKDRLIDWYNFTEGNYQQYNIKMI